MSTTKLARQYSEERKSNLILIRKEVNYLFSLISNKNVFLSLFFITTIFPSHLNIYHIKCLPKKKYHIKSRGL